MSNPVEALVAELRRYETQEIESMPGLKGHEDWIRADELEAALASLRPSPSGDVGSPVDGPRLRGGSRVAEPKQPQEQMMDKTKAGLYRKFDVRRTDGSSAPGAKHEGCSYFVLDLTHASHAIPALRAYAESCRKDYPTLADDLDKGASKAGAAERIGPTYWDARRDGRLSCTSCGWDVGGGHDESCYLSE